MIKINNPLLWRDKLKFPTALSNKYSRGWVVIVGGEKGKTGAAKLASIASMRSGAGMATILCNPSVMDIYSNWVMSVMTHQIQDINDYKQFIQNDRISVILIGPGAGVNDRTKEFVLAALKLKRPCVLDADAISVFQPNPKELFDALHPNVVLTPHFGEFERIFDTNGAIEEVTLAAAKKAGCVVLLKGNDTIIADQSGKIVINKNATPFLATAGSGDVLSGIIAGLIATGTDDIFDSVCAGVWIHSECGKRGGVGMISEDINHYIPNVLGMFL